VKAIQDGRKTQTRRVVKGLPAGIKCASLLPESGYKWRFTDFEGVTIDMRCPYGRPPVPLEPSDRLWVKETFTQFRAPTPAEAAQANRAWLDIATGRQTDIVAAASKIPFPTGEIQTLYAADLGGWAKNPDCDIKWTSPLFLPRNASRLLLEIIDIRVERLQDITEGDAKAEGVEPAHDLSANEFVNGSPVQRLDKGKIINSPYALGYMRGWDGINAKRGFSWASNPWVWVVEFKRLEAKQTV
jgi:hypothetical protein